MASSYFGGPEADYEAVNANDNFVNDEEVYDGTGEFWTATKSLVAGADPFVNAADHLDIANIVDFMLLWVSGNSESEFRSFGSDVRGIPFKFMIKDADGFLRMPGASKAGHNGPLGVMSRMRTGTGGSDFDILVADRIHKHFFNDGALTPDRNIERLQRRVDEARLGFISESARWGDVFREFTSWEGYQTNLVNNHFPQLTGTMISRFKAEGMYPEIIAPVFSQHGGAVSPTTPVTMATDADTILYTTDGSDPRLAGGAQNPAAASVSFNGGGPTPVTYLATGHVWKYLDNGGDLGVAWRAPGYNDGAWPEGPSQLGYGSDGEGSGTTVGFGPDSGNKYATTYFRTTVDIPDPSQFLQFLVRLKYDDGAAVYLNGTEIIRTPNLPAGASASQYATSNTSSEDAWRDYTLPTSSFQAGLNTLAVEVHQASGTSSDMRMDMTVRGETSLGGGSNVSDPLFFDVPTLLRARAYNSGTGEWSALNEAFFTVDTVPASAANLVMTELHYHPANPTAPQETIISNDRDDFEFAELLNIGSETIDLGGARFDASINFSFPLGTVLAPGERLLLLRNRLAFEARYGSLPSLRWFEYTGRFSNDGERVTLSGSDLNPILDFTYNDQLPWPTAADGTGPSLVLLDPQSAPAHNDATNWTASRALGGTPGEEESSGIAYPDWAAGYGLVGGPDDDDDRDGLSNFLEFLYGSHPGLRADAPGLQLRLQPFEVDNVTEDYLVISYQQNREALGALTVEVSDDLLDWSADPALIKHLSTIDNGDGTATVTVRFSQPAGAVQERSFVRLRGE